VVEEPAAIAPITRPYPARSIASPSCSGFAPISRGDARVLILGSLPGRASLQAAAYYAHPRNAFWSILGSVCDFSADLAYVDRLQRLVECRIALWDVCATAVRRGSLDASIERATIEVNDFDTFFSQHPDLVQIVFNGTAAAQLYRRLVQPALRTDLKALPSVVLPSTSPAHATVDRAGKRRRWRTALVGHLELDGRRS
jgi:double-stranded uracil-DNA glycosylase